MGWVVCGVLTAAVGASKDADVQGLYQGAGGAEARLVALGKGEFMLLLREAGPGGAVARTEYKGKLTGETVAFKAIGGKGEAAEYSAGVVTCKGVDGSDLRLERVQRKSPTLGKKPPADAVVLIDGKSFDRMVRRGGMKWYVDDMSRDGWAVWEVPVRTIAKGNPTAWPTADKPTPEGWVLESDQRRRVDTVLGIGEDGSIQVPKGGMNSKEKFEGSFDLHVEFMCPLRADARSQGRGNSGCYLPCGTEVQVLDSFGMATYLGGGCGGLYKWKDPDTMQTIEALGGAKESKFNLSCLPPLEWQTYDIEYRVRKGANGKPAGFLTVYHNGTRIHDNVKLKNAPRKGPFHYQDHGNPVRYRNIWMMPK